MALEIKLSQKLSQSLVMTPQLQQAIRLLQLGREEYLEEIEKALLENPVLEDVREEERYVPPVPAEGSDPKDASDNGKPNDEQGKQLDRTEGDLANYFEIYNDSVSASQYPNRAAGDWDDDRPSLESSLAPRMGLPDHLLWQARTSELTPTERDIATFIVGNLDPSGYLTISIEEICQVTKSSAEVVERVLSVLQSFDPIGVCARDLPECLLLQLNALGQGESLAGSIVKNGLGKLETRRYDTLAKECGVSLDQIYEAVKLIQKLEPRPGRPFVDEEPIYITPDIFVRKIEGDWKVSLNEAGMPKLRLSKSYQELADKDGKGPRSEKEYLQERVKSASWLIRSIQQRQQTIYKVAESIMRFQREFLDQGTSALKPLVLREVAEDVQMHESTVSRVTTSKYIHTPHGVFELKFFFSSGLSSAEGSISSESVKEKIKTYVGAENPKQPLSDQALAEKLKKDGIDIARRTVAKYREMMSIPSSSSRKRVF